MLSMSRAEIVTVLNRDEKVRRLSVDTDIRLGIVTIGQSMNSPTSTKTERKTSGGNGMSASFICWNSGAVENAMMKMMGMMMNMPAGKYSDHFCDRVMYRL